MRTRDSSLVDKYIDYFEEEKLKRLYLQKIQQDFLSGLAELEIASTFYKKGISITPDPRVDNRKADIKIAIDNRDIFIEITVIKEVSKDVVKVIQTRHKHVVLLEIPTWEKPAKREPGIKYLLDKIVNKILEEIYQLPDNTPNLLFLDIEDPLVSMHDVEDVIFGFPYFVVNSETMETRIQREEFEPFRTIEDLLTVLKRVSLFAVYEEGNLKEANIYINSNNANFPLSDKEREFIIDFIRSF